MAARTEKEKVSLFASLLMVQMLSGDLYISSGVDLQQEHAHAVELANKFNAIPPSREFNSQRTAALLEMIPHQGSGCSIEAPFHCDYGTNIYLGRLNRVNIYLVLLGNNVSMNFNCVILDCNKVTIGSGTLIAPNVGV